jgi:lysophospholipase L1-like esterase
LLGRDSITQGGDYVTDLECWLLAEHLPCEVLNLGLGSETAAELTPAENAGHLAQYHFGRPAVGERLARALAATKPDLVFACYGMNDSSGLPATPEGDARYQEAITRLRTAALAAGAKRVILCSPPIRSSAEDASLARYAAWLVSQRSAGWETVDIHTPMHAALVEHQQREPNFSFAKDGVHPGREGHWIMAREILTQGLGAQLTGVTTADAFFPAHGAEIRELVNQRMKLRFAAWMTKIGHQRPGVPGAPGFKPTMTFAEAEAKAQALTAQIEALLGTP